MTSGRRSRALAIGLALSLGAAAAGSCSSPVECTPDVPITLLGAWNYSAVQSSPSAANLGGTLDITSQCGRDFIGTLDVTETDAVGGTRRLTGTVSGQALDSTSVDFDAFVDTPPMARRHVGTVARDTIRGTWVEPTSGGASASGSFQGVKAPPP